MIFVSTVYLPGLRTASCFFRWWDDCNHLKAPPILLENLIHKQPKMVAVNVTVERKGIQSPRKRLFNLYMQRFLFIGQRRF
eukprot:1456906-Amphidinium_carterae.1